jgi:hypothetical protein
LGLDRTGAEPVIRAYVDHINRVLNRTVTDGRLVAIRDPQGDARFDVSRIVRNNIASLELHGRGYLLIQQKIDVRDNHCETLTYYYRYQKTEEPESWLFRWEWFRRPPKPDYPYPLAHFHVNAVFIDRQTTSVFAEHEDISGIHFPTARIAIEQVLWGLIAEWGVRSKSDDWREILTESLEGFEERRQSP